MFDPRILLGLILAGAWASGLLALDEEIERDEHRQPETPASEHAGSDQRQDHDAQIAEDTEVTEANANA